MRYQYTSKGFKKIFYQGKQFTNKAISSIILINIFVFIFSSIIGDFWVKNNFALIPQEFKIWQLVTYMFLHGGPIHLFFNMFLLWMFGKELEKKWGTSNFILYYFISGIGAGIFVLFFGQAVIGASGAVMAVLLAYGFLYPNRILLFYFIPMKAKYCVIMLIIIELINQITYNPYDNVSHIAHLGGMITGYLYIRYSKSVILLLSKTFPSVIIKHKNKDSNFSSDSKIVNNESDEVDKILEKLKHDGWIGLSDKEKNILFKRSKNLKDRSHPN